MKKSTARGGGTYTGWVKKAFRKFIGSTKKIKLPKRAWRRRRRRRRSAYSICYTPAAVEVGDYPSPSNLQPCLPFVWSSSVFWVFFFCFFFFLQLIYLVYQSVDYDDDASFNCFCAKGDGSRPLFVGVAQERQTTKTTTKNTVISASCWRIAKRNLG